MIALLVMTDGRDNMLERTLAQPEFLNGLITERWIHDDTGHEYHRTDLARRFPGFTVIGSGKRRGFGGAIRYAWDVLAERSRAELVLHWEDDFIAAGLLDLYGMACVLKDYPHLAQMALKRQPWGPAEEAAGGFMAMHPDAYTPRTDGALHWLEQRLFWTTNPSLYRRSLCERGWPAGRRSETAFGASLLADPSVAFGYWGRLDDPPLVEHIGAQRVGHGY